MASCLEVVRQVRAGCGESAHFRGRRRRARPGLPTRGHGADLGDGDPTAALPLSFYGADCIIIPVRDRRRAICEVEFVAGPWLCTSSHACSYSNLVTGETRNLTLSAPIFASVSGDRVVFSVFETQQGGDLNGDGDTGDVVWHVTSTFAVGRDHLRRFCLAREVFGPPTWRWAAKHHTIARRVC